MTVFTVVALIAIPPPIFYLETEVSWWCSGASGTQRPRSILETVNTQHKHGRMWKCPKAHSYWCARCWLFCSGSRSSKTFKPKKNIPEGSHQYELLKHAEATLGSGNLRQAVMLPDGEDLNEWIAVNSKQITRSVLLHIHCCGQASWTIVTKAKLALSKHNIAKCWPQD